MAVAAHRCGVTGTVAPASLRQCRLYSGLRPALPRPANEVRGDPWPASPVSGAAGEERQALLADGGPPFRISRPLRLQPPSCREGLDDHRKRKNHSRTEMFCR